METQARSSEVTSACMPQTVPVKGDWGFVCIAHLAPTRSTSLLLSQASQLSSNISTIPHVYKISGDTKEL